MKKLALTITGICSIFIVLSQQDIQFSQVISNPYLFNPAAGGMSDVGELNIGMRTQWLSVEGKPVTYYVSGQSRIRVGKKSEEAALMEFNTEKHSFYATPERTIGKKHIVGGKVVADQIGPFSRTGFTGSYAIHMPFTKKINVGLGIGLGAMNFGINDDKVKLHQGDDAAYLSYIGASGRQGMIDVQTGLVFYNKNFYFGISGSQLMKNKVSFKGIDTESNLERHLYAVGSYYFGFKEYGLEPVVILKNTTASPLSYDAGLRFHYRGMGWLSLGYRGNSALSAGFGINALQHFRLAYAFEMGLSGLRTFGNGSHEIQLGFIFGRNRNMDKEFRDQKKEHDKQIEDELKIGTE